MMYLFVFVLSFSILTANARAKDDDVSVSGTLHFSSKIKAGPAYLMVSPGSDNGPVIFKTEDNPEKPGEKREAPPTDEKFRGYLSIGSVSGDSSSFTVDLPPGTYTLSAFVKNGGGDEPKCVVMSRNDRQVAMSCFAAKNDTSCAGQQVDVTKDKKFDLYCGDFSAPKEAKENKGSDK